MNARGSGGGRGGKGGGKDNRTEFVRNVPNFLKQYSHMLTANKKNYMGETLGKEEMSADITTVIEDGAVIVDPIKNRNKDNLSDDDDLPPSVEIIPVSSEQSSETAFSNTVNKNTLIKPEDIATGQNVHKNIEFSKPTKKRKNIEDERDSRIKSKTVHRNVNVLSFDTEDS